MGSLAHQSKSIMASLDRKKWHVAILFIFVASAIGFSSGNSTLRQEYLARKSEGMKTSITTPANPVEIKTTQESIGSETEGNRIVKDLLAPIPRSVCLLAKLTSMQNLDTGTARNQSSILQIAHSFHTTFLQISLKLNNAFLVSNVYGYKIKLHGVIVASKVKVVAEYLEKFKNSNRMIEFIDLPLVDLKQTADQTFNFSSQIAGQFGELVRLVEEVSNSLTLKTEQVRNASADIENEIRDLKRQKMLDEADFNNAMDDLKHLQDDVSQCYWAYNWRTLRKDIRYCPEPYPSRIRQANQSVRIAKAKLENTMKSLHAEEEEAQKKREEGNQLLITTESLEHEMHQLNGDLQLLGNTSDPLYRLRKNHLKKLDVSWNKFVAICRDIQSGAKKNLEIIEEANRTSTHWSHQHSEKISFNLNKTKENLLLVKTVIDVYLEGSSEDIVEIFAEVEQMMTKRENPGELERIQNKCKKTFEEIKTLSERNKGPIKPQTPKQIPKGKDSRPEKNV